MCFSYLLRGFRPEGGSRRRCRGTPRETEIGALNGNNTTAQQCWRDMSEARPGEGEPASARENLAVERAGAVERIESLRRQLTSIREVSTWTGTDDEHDPEGATIAYERAQLHGLLTDATRELEALDRAAIRVENGSYGRCETCGNDIAPARLEALPAASTCITCATRR